MLYCHGYWIFFSFPLFSAEQPICCWSVNSDKSKAFIFNSCRKIWRFMLRDFLDSMILSSPWNLDAFRHIYLLDNYILRFKIFWAEYKATRLSGICRRVWNPEGLSTMTSSYFYWIYMGGLKLEIWRMLFTLCNFRFRMLWTWDWGPWVLQCVSTERYSITCFSLSLSFFLSSAIPLSSWTFWLFWQYSVKPLVILSILTNHS